ncbi:MAG: AAA family ATPase [Mycobacterium sp.]|nr:AAA family ATPase [Mycobacterium sp.]
MTRRAVVEWASAIPPQRQVWLWDNRIPVGTLSAFAGRGNTGKTTYALHLAAQLSHGTLPGEHHGTKRRTLIWSGEDDWGPVLVPRLMAAGADLTLIGRLAIETIIDADTREASPRLPLDVDTMKTAIQSSGAALVIIDPIASTMSGDLHREADVRVALDGLARLAAETGAVAVFIRHFGKGGGNASDKMSGSHAFRDAARSVFLFAEDGDQTVVSQDKGNYSARGEESFAFRLENTAVPTDTGTAQVARVIDLGATETSVDDIINRCPGASDADENDTRDCTTNLTASWLYQLLADAEKEKVVIRPKDAVAYGADKGISRRSVFRLFGTLANARLAESVDGTGFPKTTNWRAKDGGTAGTAGPTLGGPGTTGTTGVDLQKQRDTAGEQFGIGGTTEETIPEQEKQADQPPVVPVVPPNLRAGAPGAPTAATPGMTERVQRILANQVSKQHGSMQ